MPLLRRRLHAEGLSVAPAPVATAAHPATARVVWRFSDGKAGHDSQSQGLVDALQRCMDIDCYDIAVAKGAALDWLRQRFPAGELLPDPWLVIGAGHATHLPLLAARRARGRKKLSY